VTPPVAASVAL
jgi:hypothetical protein